MARKKTKTNAKEATAVAPMAETTKIALSDGVEFEMVRIPGKDYWMGRFEVTQAQWKAVTGESPSAFSFGRDSENNPVEQVSWDDCQAFLETLNAQPAAKASGLVFRLPTEEEWEFAARAGATGDYCKLADGTEITEETLGEVAWFEGNSGGMTNPVGQKKPNAFGLYDVFGNVLEWTATAAGEKRFACGGSWLISAGNTTSWCRFWISPSDRSDEVGFRLCAERRAD